MPKEFPLEFRRDVVAVAVARQSDARVARDFGIPEPCLQRWLKLDDVEKGRRPGVSRAESAELREAKKRLRLLEPGERGLAARGGVSGTEREPSMRYSLVGDLAGEGTPSLRRVGCCASPRRPSRVALQTGV
jgi:transposase